MASLGGQITAAEIMAGQTNQVKVMLEESLLVLSDEVIAEVFRNSTNIAAAGSSSERSGGDPEGSTMSREGGEPMLRRRIAEETRMLVVEVATSATLDDVQDVGE